MTRIVDRDRDDRRRDQPRVAADAASRRTPRWRRPRRCRWRRRGPPRASAGASLMPSPTIATRPPLGLQPLRSSRPCRAGRTSAIDAVRRRCRRRGPRPRRSRARRRSAARPRSRPRAAPAPPRPTPVGPGRRSRSGRRPAPSTATNTTVAAVRGGGPRRLDERREVDAPLGHQPPAADGDLAPVDRRRGRRVRRCASNPSTAGSPSSPSRARADDRLAERDARTARLERGRRGPAARRASNPAAGTTTVDRRAGRAVSVPVLSKTTVSTRPAVSSASPPRMRIPASAALARPDHDRGRRGEAHGARAGDDHDRR